VLLKGHLCHQVDVGKIMFLVVGVWGYFAPNLTDCLYSARFASKPSTIVELDISMKYTG
jgi:hypothetical protein